MDKVLASWMHFTYRADNMLTVLHVENVFQFLLKTWYFSRGVCIGLWLLITRNLSFFLRIGKWKL